MTTLNSKDPWIKASCAGDPSGFFEGRSPTNCSQMPGVHSLVEYLGLYEIQAQRPFVIGVAPTQTHPSAGADGHTWELGCLERGLVIKKKEREMSGSLMSQESQNKSVKVDVRLVAAVQEAT